MDKTIVESMYNTVEGSNSFEKFVNIYPIAKNEDSFGIMVGCANFNANDFRRHKCSKRYSLFITTKENIENVTEIDISLQSSMFTVFIEDIDLSLIKDPFVTLICFDLMTAYFCNRLEYFHIIDKLLVRSGLVFFDRTDHMSYLHMFTIKNGEQQWIDLSSGEQKEEPTIVTKYFDFDFNEKRMTLKPELALEFFDKETNTLSAQTIVSVREKVYQGLKTNYIKYSCSIEDEYEKYLESYFSDYTVGRETYSYDNYSYPDFQIRYCEKTKREYIELWNCNELSFLINCVMTEEEMHAYVRRRIFPRVLFNRLIERMKSTPSYAHKFMRANNIVRFSYDDFKLKCKNQLLKKKVYYIISKN